MPYTVQQRGDKWAVVAKDTGKVVGTHDSKSEATAQLRALYANVPDSRGKH